uniref:Oligomycin sensitivity conferral protein n=1 Tax=Heliothis virescens TaxID=7102 RepID=A0A2A4JBF0_HELVI
MFRMFVRALATAPRSKKTPIPVFGLEGRYVTALYSAASQKDELDHVEKGLRELQKVLTKPKVVDFIETSLIPRAVKAKLLISIGKEAGLPATATNFLGLVAENGRLKHLRRMINMFHVVMVAHRNEALCEVITADPLDDATRKAISDVLKKFVKPGKNIQLKEIVTPDAIGGVVIGFEDQHIDMTIATRLNKYRELIKQIA